MLYIHRPTLEIVKNDVVVQTIKLFPIKNSLFSVVGLDKDWSHGDYLVHLKYQNNRGFFSFNKGKLSSGVYFYSIYDSKKILSEGQFLILCPHQSNDEIQQRLYNLNDTLRASFFANLGDFIILFDYAYDTPSMQDIDPYIFLSKIRKDII